MIMTKWMIVISQIAAGGVRAVVFLFFVFWLLSSKKPGKKSIAAAFTGAVISSILFTLLPVMGLPDVYRMALETVWFAVCASRFQGADARMSLYVSFFYEIAVSLWQFLFAAWLGVLFHVPAFLDNETGSGQIVVWLLHALLAAFVLYGSKRQRMTEKEAIRVVSVIAVTGLLAVITLSEQTTLAIADDTLDMWRVLALILLIAVLVFHMNRQYEVEKELARLKSEQTELLERDYTTLNHAYAINAKLFHDFHNHIGVLRQLLSHKKLEDAMQYLNELQAPVQEMTDTIWTGDETLDYLINSKAALAETGGIDMQVQVEFPRHTNIRSADLCAILGNLLDNALEAAGQAPETEQRFIQLTIRRINQMLVIKVENSSSVLPIKKDQALKTTKEDNGLHGWGLKSAQTAAEKYDGMVQTSYVDHIFRAVVTLSYQGV